jgi:S-formylglutathione hydrolase FrmB
MEWINGDEATAPIADQVLVSVPVESKSLMKGLAVGLFITCDEGNSFYLNWTHQGVVRTKRFDVIGGGMFIYLVESQPINKRNPADEGTSITITVINTAVSTAAKYQGSLMIR